eukprot:TRINITY_DN67917_c0_g1_i1.p1 TRINITY_DN67917_c0_g1~~TRINITY_DN67917_c0_g1_i1.p1  ORF type:complete len:160 (-),score=16.96 TRINITY_DN67917_c0_g1_i1:246-725(-)
MPLAYALFIQAELEGISGIRFPEGSEWSLLVQKRGASGSAAEEVMVSTGRAGHVAWNDLHGVDRTCCDRSAREATVRIITDPRQFKLKQGSLGEYTGSPPLSPVAVFMCDGCEPVEWRPSGPVKIQTESGTEREVDFEGGVWVSGHGKAIIDHHEFCRL